MTQKKVEWTRPAAKDLERLDRPTRDRIRTAVHELVETGRGDVKKLKGYAAEWRLRVGDWRVRFTVDQAGTVVVMIVLRVRSRGSAYEE